MGENTRSIARIVEPIGVLEGAGVRLKRTIASRALNYLDPFLLLDHFGSEDPDDYIKGFPWHPHRGIETVTYMLAGQVAHKDSIGNAGTIGAGDVQWMTAGGGIMHEEMPAAVDGRMAGFQLWVNLPARLKMMQPRYQDIAAAQIREARLADGTCIRVISGQVNGVQGPVTDIAADPTYLDVSVPAGGLFAHPIPRGHTVFAYPFEGAGIFAPGADLTPSPNLVVYADGDRVEVRSGSEGVRFLLVSGEPLGEPIARYGPFVMNTREEIEQALRDLQNGTFVWRPSE